MARITEAGIERRRGRILGSLLLLLVAFASAFVIFSFADPDVLTFLHVTPGAARLGFLLLTFGLLALVWEKEREYRRVSEELHRQRLLGAAFRSRLDVVEGLLRAGERLNAPLGVDEVLAVLLDAALDLAGGVGGRATLTDEDGADLQVTQHVPAHGWEKDSLRTVTIPLKVNGGSIANIELFFPAEQDVPDVVAVEVLERFAGQAAQTLERATLVARDRAALDNLRASQIVRSRFLAAVSHELRTPLTSIIGFSQTLDHHWKRLDEDRKVQAVQAIGTESNRLWRMVERMLDAARLELEGMNVQPRLHDVRRTVARTLKPFLEREPDRLVLEAEEDPLTVEVDPFVVSRAISNLVDNSLKYTEGLVRVRSSKEEDNLVLRVQDEGPGLTPEQLAEATQPLFRVEDNVKSGTGLGLHVVRSLVAEHHGTFEMQSGASGTCVVVTLPSHPAPEPSARRASRYARPRSGADSNKARA